MKQCPFLSDHMHATFCVETSCALWAGAECAFLFMARDVIRLAPSGMPIKFHDGPEAAFAAMREKEKSNPEE